MHFENSETVEYKRNILFQVVFQARFPEIMKIQHDPPIVFQDNIRTEGYTEFIQSAPAILPGITPNQALDTGKNFHFLSEEKDWEVILSRNFISLNCHRNYRDYTDFKERLEKVLRIFYSIYKPPYFTRIGLMYRNMANNVFLPHLQMSVESFIPKHIFPVLATSIADDVLHLETVSHFNDNENLRAGVTHTLSQISGVYGQKQVTNEKSYIIDIDCFYERNVGEIDEIFAKCDIFKQLEWNIFQWSITDALQEAIGKSES